MKVVNFDHAAAAPMLPEAREVMLSFLGDQFGNPASLHRLGSRPRAAVEWARQQVAALVNATPRDMVFTASASESNNHALKGLARAASDRGRHLIVSGVEHVSVLEPARTLVKDGWELTELPVDREGRVSPVALAAAIRPDTVLVSVMHANNEVGTVQELKELARVSREHNVLFHSDGTAAVGRLSVDVVELGVDAYSFPAQSVYGPRGAAALYLRPGARIRPLVEGGFQERNRRAGTENIAAIAGFGAAAKIAGRSIGRWSTELARLGRRVIAELPAKLDHLVFTGPTDDRLPGHVSVCVEFVEGEAMLLSLDDEDIAAASGSSCTVRTLKVSHVLLAMGLPHALAQSSLVLTLGITTTDAEVDYLLDKLPPIVARLRQMSPLYAKFRRGEDPYAAAPGAACEDDHPPVEED
ncbi:MAG: cysteine desulfurase family protein [bacterium]